MPVAGLPCAAASARGPRAHRTVTACSCSGGATSADTTSYAVYRRDLTGWRLVPGQRRAQPDRDAAVDRRSADLRRHHGGRGASLPVLRHRPRPRLEPEPADPDHQRGLIETPAVGVGLGMPGVWVGNPPGDCDGEALGNRLGAWLGDPRRRTARESRSATRWGIRPVSRSRCRSAAGRAGRRGRCRTGTGARSGVSRSSGGSRPARRRATTARRTSSAGSPGLPGRRGEGLVVEPAASPGPRRLPGPAVRRVRVVHPGRVGPALDEHAALGVPGDPVRPGQAVRSAPASWQCRLVAIRSFGPEFRRMNRAASIPPGAIDSYSVSGGCGELAQGRHRRRHRHTQSYRDRDHRPGTAGAADDQPEHADTERLR